MLANKTSSKCHCNSSFLNLERAKSGPFEDVSNGRERSLSHLPDLERVCATLCLHQ